MHADKIDTEGSQQVQAFRQPVLRLYPLEEKMVHDQIVPSAGQCRERVMEAGQHPVEHRLPPRGAGLSQSFAIRHHVLEAVEGDMQIRSIHDLLQGFGDARLPGAGRAVEEDDSYIFSVFQELFAPTMPLSSDQAHLCKCP